VTQRISIIGLGQIGSSIGLALQEHKGLPKIVGHDVDRKTASLAEQIGAVSEAVSLRNAAKDAAIVFLCVPLGEIPRLLQEIRPQLAEGAIIFDTGPSKMAVLSRLDEMLPASCHYVGLFPAPCNEMLASPKRGIEGASAEYFHRSVVAVVPPRQAGSRVEQVAVDVVKLLGATPMLTDQAEADGLATAVHLLPQLAASALLEATVGVSGWLDARKLAGRAFTAISGGAAYYDDSASLAVAALANREATLHRLDLMIGALKGLQEDIRETAAGRLSERLGRSFAAREQWLDERGSAAWLDEGGGPLEGSGAGEHMLQLLFGAGLVERTKPKGRSQ
jgi:cyclohexadieny/prephenate dehydrogenase